MANNLKVLREARGWSQDTAAAAIGTTKSQYVKLERGFRRLSTPWIDKAAQAFGVDPGVIVAGPKSAPPIVGCVVEGGLVQWLADEPPAREMDVALRVDGDGLGHLLAGFTVVFQHRRLNTSVDITGVLCVCRSNGRTAVRKVCVTSSRNTHLIAPSGGIEFDVKVDWLSPIDHLRFDQPDRLT